MYLFVCPSLVLDTKHGRPKCYTWLERSFRPDVQRKKLIDFGPRNGDFYPKNHFLTYEGVKKRREEECDAMRNNTIRGENLRKE